MNLPPCPLCGESKGGYIASYVGSVLPVCCAACHRAVAYTRDRHSADEAWNTAASHAQGLRDRILELENEAREQALQALASEGQWIEQTGAQQKRIAELDAQRQWQPIETAPMDGQKVILFYLNRNNFRRTVMARWVTDEQAAETDADDVGLEAGWYECIDNWDDYCQVCIHEGEPTHWMPLPPPPVERAHGIEEAKR